MCLGTTQTYTLFVQLVTQIKTKQAYSFSVLILHKPPEANLHIRKQSLPTALFCSFPSRQLHVQS